MRFKVCSQSTNDDDPSRGKGHLRVSMLEVTHGKIMYFFIFFFWKYKKTCLQNIRPIRQICWVSTTCNTPTLSSIGPQIQALCEWFGIFVRVKLFSSRHHKAWWSCCGTICCLEPPSWCCLSFPLPSREHGTSLFLGNGLWQVRVWMCQHSLSEFILFNSNTFREQVELTQSYQKSSPLDSSWFHHLGRARPLLSGWQVTSLSCQTNAHDPIHTGSDFFWGGA